MRPYELHWRTKSPLRILPHRHTPLKSAKGKDMVTLERRVDGEGSVTTYGPNGKPQVFSIVSADALGHGITEHANDAVTLYYIANGLKWFRGKIF